MLELDEEGYVAERLMKKLQGVGGEDREFSVEHLRDGYATETMFETAGQEIEIADSVSIKGTIDGYGFELFETREENYYLSTFELKRKQRKMLEVTAKPSFSVVPRESEEFEVEYNEVIGVDGYIEDVERLQQSVVPPWVELSDGFDAAADEQQLFNIGVELYGLVRSDVRTYLEEQRE